MQIIKFMFSTAAFFSFITLTTVTIAANAVTVHNLDEFNAAVKTLRAGDEVVMANGTWQDVELRIKGAGTLDQPINLRAEESGKVVIAGQSNL